MAEVILPPIETEPEVPEVVIPEVEKPTALSKVISVKFNPLNTKVTTSIDTHEGFATTDTDAWVIINILDMAESIGKYSLVLHNREDGSIFQRVGDIVKGVAYYKLIPDEIKHAGRWVGQVVVTLENGQTTTSRFSFNVAGHLLDGKDVREIVIQDFQTLMKQLNDLKDNATNEFSFLKSEIEAFQTIAQESEDERKTNELGRVAAEIIREENYESKVTAAIVEADVVEKVDNKVAELSPTIQQVTAQFQQTNASKVDKNGSGQIDYANLSQEIRLKFTGDKVAVVEDDSIINTNVTDKAISSRKTDFFEQGYNIANLCVVKKGFTISLSGGSYKEVVSELDKILYIPINQTGTFIYFSEETSSLSGKALIVNEFFEYTNAFDVTDSISNKNRHSTYKDGYYAVAFNLSSEINVYDVGLRDFKNDKVDNQHDLLRTMLEKTGNLISTVHNVRLLNHTSSSASNLALDNSFSMSNVFPFDKEIKYAHNFTNTIGAYPRFYLLDSNLDFVAHVKVDSDYSTYVTAKYACLITDSSIENPYCSTDGERRPKYVLPSKYVRFNSEDLIVTNYKNNVFSALGDSLTASGKYHEYVKEFLKLKTYKNCGIGGTFVSGDGASSNELFWKDSRINSLDNASDWITIMGGTNDSSYRDVGLMSLDNEDVKTFVGAYNVMISKIIYKYLKLSEGHYSTIDYVGVSQLSEKKDIKILLITPPKRFDTPANTVKSELFAETVVKIGKLWGYPVVEANSNMQMNLVNTSEFFRTDKIHFNEKGHKNLADLIIGKLKSVDSSVR